MPAPAAELVVARFRENLNWLRRVPRSIRRTVYDKSGEPPTVPGAIPLPNVGREAHTYLHHIVERYDTLAEATIFCQGHPFDHAPSLHRTLRELAAGSLAIADFLWLGFLIDRDDAQGARLFQHWSKNPERRPLPMADFSRAVWDAPAPAEVVFHGGAQFIVSATCIRRQPLAFYTRALAAACSIPDAAHCFERTWDRVFGVCGIENQYRAGPFPVYLKPIRRLQQPQP